MIPSRLTNYIGLPTASMLKPHTPEAKTLLEQLAQQGIHMAVTDDATVEDIWEAVMIIQKAAIVDRRDEKWS